MAANILVVDDDKETTIIFKVALARLGYNAIITRNVQEAEAVLKETMPDAVLLDLMMPGRSGLDLLIKIRRTPRLAHLYVVLISAHSLEHEEKPDDIEPDMILRKPIRIPELERALGARLA